MGRVEGGHGITVTVGKKKEQKETVLTAKTFRKIEVDMDMSQNSQLKLKRILKGEVKVEAGIREALRTWDIVALSSWSFTGLRTLS